MILYKFVRTNQRNEKQIMFIGAWVLRVSLKTQPCDRIKIGFWPVVNPIKVNVDGTSYK